jgi:hypothetical protein
LRIRLTDLDALSNQKITVTENAAFHSDFNNINPLTLGMNLVSSSGITPDFDFTVDQSIGLDGRFANMNLFGFWTNSELSVDSTFRFYFTDDTSALLQDGVFIFQISSSF